MAQMKSKIERAHGSAPVFVRHGIKIYFTVHEPKTALGKRRIDISVRATNKRWRHHHLLQYPFGFDMQFENVGPGEIVVLRPKRDA